MPISLDCILPQHLLTQLAGKIAECRCPRTKNWIIRTFIQKYKVNMQEAEDENIEAYTDFNSFFIRKLKPELRPIVQEANQIACPVDGVISQIGYIQEDTLLQAKGFTFELAALLGSPQHAESFKNGAFATLYLSPKDYHRVHMPLTGKLRETIYIPGKLFSVNPRSVRSIKNLFARNERLVCIFDTEIGPMAVIMVGAIIVGSINTVWDDHIATKNISSNAYYEKIEIERGGEMGYFKLGSTAIILFGKDTMSWSEGLKENSAVRMGQEIGSIQM